MFTDKVIFFRCNRIWSSKNFVQKYRNSTVLHFKSQMRQDYKMYAKSTTVFKILRSKQSKIVKIWCQSCLRRSSKAKGPRLSGTRLGLMYYEVVDPTPTKYGGITNITVLPGVGIGPEIMQSTLQVLQAAEAPLSYEVMTIKPESDGDDFDQVLTSIKRNKVAIKANIETKSKDPLVPSRNISLRKLLDLYVYILPLKSFPGISKHAELDLVIVRQNTEGEYLMLEHEPVKGSVESLKVITRHNTKRLAEYAYKYAIANKRKLVTVVHTADVHQLTEGLFVESVLKVSAKYPQIQTEVKEAGTTAIELLNKPETYDMIIATNLNGAMMSNLLNGMLGGPALSAGTNLNERGIAVFEPGVRNKGSSIVNKGIANPTAMLMAASNLLVHLGHDKTSQIIRNAIYRSTVYDRMLSQELGGTATTREITDNIIRHVRNLLGPSQRNTKPSKVKHKRWKVQTSEERKTGDECKCQPS